MNSEVLGPDGASLYQTEMLDDALSRHDFEIAQQHGRLCKIVRSADYAICLKRRWD